MNREELPRITFGVIVLNGEPFTRYCLRALYPFAHEIIVVEGGHEDARVVSTPDGHSTDGTLATVRGFMRDEDPEGKVQLVTREGFWPKRDEFGKDRTPQSRAYAERATGDYLWQVDIDEFYRPGDMTSVIAMLQDDPSITAVSFRQRTIWGGLHYAADGWALRRGLDVHHRLFRWRPGYRYATHEPPTVLDESGTDLRAIRWVRARDMERRGIILYHYSLLFPEQVRLKAALYDSEKPDLCPGILEWADRSYSTLDRPFRVHNLYEQPSWLERFDGPHPPEIVRMMADINSGKIACELRDNRDVERLLRRRSYRTGRAALRLLEPTDRRVRASATRTRDLVARRLRQATRHD